MKSVTKGPRTMFSPKQEMNLDRPSGAMPPYRWNSLSSSAKVQKTRMTKRRPMKMTHTSEPKVSPEDMYLNCIWRAM
jgi:hypothetical protein